MASMGLRVRIRLGLGLALGWVRFGVRVGLG